MKLQLKVELLKNKIAKITIIYACDEALANNNKQMNKLFIEDNITIWSFSDFIFDDRQIRLPEKRKILRKLSHKHQFKSENERYQTLKKFYKVLNKWSLDTSLFPNTNTDIEKRIRIANGYWIVI